MKIARYIFRAIGLLMYFWGALFWPQTGEMFLNVVAIAVGIAMVVCSFLIFRNPEIRPWD